jgi:hypothetical protein
MTLRDEISSERRRLRDFAEELEIPDDTASNIYAAEMRRAERLLGKLARFNA